jgi:short-subunit dehydrogenase
MSKTESLKGRTALVTGASSGMGVDYARELARRGADLILVARRAAALERLAQALHADHGIEARIRPADLTDAAARERLYRQIEAEGRPVDLLLNNAGVGLCGPFVDADWGRLDPMLQLDVVALTHLTRLFTPGMVARRWGRILLVASVAAFQPSPPYAAYAAAKSYVLSFGLALRHELHGTGVSCTVACPGVTATAFFEVAGQRPTRYHRLMGMPSARAAALGLQALLAQRSLAVIGRRNAVLAWSTRLLPRTWAAALADRLMKNESPSPPAPAYRSRDAEGKALSPARRPGGPATASPGPEPPTRAVRTTR